MRRTLLLLAGLVVGFAPAPLPKQHIPDAASQDDLRAMQGVWTERFADSAAVTITGDRMVHTSDVAWKLTLRAKSEPRRIVAVGDGPGVTGKTRVGIYRLEDGKLIICWRRQPGGKLEWPSSPAPLHEDVWIEVFTPVKQ